MERRCAIGLAQTPRRTWKGGCLPAERGRLQIVGIWLTRGLQQTKPTTLKRRRRQGSGDWQGDARPVDLPAGLDRTGRAVRTVHLPAPVAGARVRVDYAGGDSANAVTYILGLQKSKRK